MFSKTAKALVGLVGLVTLTGAEQRPQTYAEGQVWEYHHRAGDDGSQLKIQKIELSEARSTADPIYHISVVGVNFSGIGLADGIQHLPVSRQTLDASVTQPAKSPASFPDPTEGIAQWRAAKGGVFKIPVAEIVEMVGQQFQQRPAD